MSVDVTWRVIQVEIEAVLMNLPWATEKCNSENLGK
jgi:hypothetical protein